MNGFNKYFNESLTDFAIEISRSPNDPSFIDAVKDIISDTPNVEKYLSMVNSILGVSHMISLVPATYKSNLQILLALKDILKHPKKIKNWKKLGYYLWKSGKLTVANPLIFMPIVSPVVALLPIHKQAILLGALKAVSTVYSYLSMLANEGKGGDSVQQALSKIKFALPEIDEEKRKSA